MAVDLFTPKQVAEALGVSESSVKRWVDDGKLAAARTAGGHRRVPLPSVAQFVRASGHPLSRPEVLGMVRVTRRCAPHDAVAPLFEALTRGDEHECRQVVLGFYQRGEGIVAIGDELVGPAMRLVGDGWEEGTVSVHQERRACEVLMAALHELRRWMPEPAPAAPLAMVATPEHDFAETPARLVELTLRESGWAVVQAGSGLPIAEIRGAALSYRPALVCVSVTHCGDLDALLDRYRDDLVVPTRREVGARHALGGRAVAGVKPQRCGADVVAGLLADLDSLRNPAA